MPVAHSSEAVIRFFDVIKGDTPWIVTNDYLIAKGFKAGNHTELRGIFRGLRFLDESNMPTKRWHDYKNDPSGVLQLALKDGYHELFATFPEAEKRDKAELAAWFRENKQYSPITAIRAVRIFKRLCEYAQFAQGQPPQEPYANTQPALEDDALVNDKALRFLTLLDDFLKETLQQAVDEGIITSRQGKELFQMYAKDGMWKVKAI